MEMVAAGGAMPMAAGSARGAPLVGVLPMCALFHGERRGDTRVLIGRRRGLFLLCSLPAPKAVWMDGRAAAIVQGYSAVALACDE